MRKNLKCDPAHGANKVHPGATKKTGENKGIASANKERKREEAETRNALTPIYRTKEYRRKMKTSA